MCATPPQPTRVLLGNLAPLAGLGLVRLLTDRGMEVSVEASAARVPTAAAAMGPDAIVLPLEGRDHTPIAPARAAAPGAKLILWALDESEMHVYDAGRTHPRRVSTGMPGALMTEIENDQRPRGGD